MTEAKIDANDDHPNHQPQFHLRLLTSNSAAQRHGLGMGSNCAKSHRLACVVKRRRRTTSEVHYVRAGAGVTASH